MKKKAVVLVICIFAVLMMASTALAAVGDWVIITVPLAPTFGYTGATRTDEDDEMQYGMVGEIVGTGTNTVPGANLGSMYLVNTQYNYDQGYLRRDAGEYKLVSRAEGIAWRDAQTHWITASFADVMPEKNLNAYPPLITLYRGSLLQAVNPVNPIDADGWVEVKLHDNSTGYVRSEYLRKKVEYASPSIRFDVSTLTKEQKDAIGKQIAEDAMGPNNSNYRWAGKTPLGFDCSGLSGMAFMMNGFISYRNSRPEPGSNIWILSDNEFINGTGVPVQRAMAGFPIALKHIPTQAVIDNPLDNTTLTTSSTHTLTTLEKARPGDTLYFSGHQAVYIGNGEMTESNGTSASNRLNSVIAGSGEPAPYRSIGNYSGTYVWGTVFPDEPNKIIVGRLLITRTGTRAYRIVARIDGYMPSRAEFYPCGVDQNGSPLGVDGTTNTPIVNNITTAANMRYMLIDAINTTSSSAPSYTYPAEANGLTYKPAIKFFNESGYRPNGVTITSDVYQYLGTITVN